MNAHRSRRLLARAALASGLLALGLGACSEWAPPPPPPGLPLGAPPREKKAAPTLTTTPGQKLDTLARHTIDEWLKDDPGKARELGMHDFDGKVADFSKEAITGRIERLRKTRDAIAAVDAKSLSPDQALDQAILLHQIDLFLFRVIDVDEWHKNPRFYEDLFGVNAYLDRDYAPIAERARRLLDHEKAALGQVKHITGNLQGPMSKAVVETAIKVYKGYVDYLKNDVTKQLKGVGDAAFQKELAETNDALAAEAQKIVDHLTKVELPRGDNSHVLGADKYRKLLLVQEGLTISLADFKAMGEKNLQENKKAYEALKKKAKPSRPRAEALLGDATKLMESSREFIVKKGLVTIPFEDKAVLRETPPFMRWNAAFLNPPGPFEEAAKTAFYYITLPDPTWPKKEQEEYIMPHGTLLSTTIHEVYPGHFLQGQWERRAPTRAQMMFGSYSFIEGWAHYGEQMMIEEGFGADAPENRLGQLGDALLRNCRFIASIGIHTEGMTLDQAQKLFQKDCFQDKATAREQAVRGTFDPGYFAYTLGKIQILELRDEAKKKLGDRFSLKQFHDALLAHGSPAVPLIHDRVLAELAAE